jgi:hypothetical protein
VKNAAKSSTPKKRMAVVKRRAFEILDGSLVKDGEKSNQKR